MDAKECNNKIAELREQIMKDGVLSVHDFVPQFRKASGLLDEISQWQAITPAALKHLAQVRRSVKEFYSIGSSRGWTQKFALNDLDVLKEICCPEEGGAEGKK